MTTDLVRCYAFQMLHPRQEDPGETYPRQSAGSAVCFLFNDRLVCHSSIAAISHSRLERLLPQRNGHLVLIPPKKQLA